eukprot:9302903-Pyramimonas_sp.AAC.1
MARAIQHPGSRRGFASRRSPSAKSWASAPLTELRSMWHCLALLAASSSLCVASRARMRASSVSRLRSAGAGGLVLLSASSPNICRMSACQGIEIPCALPSASGGSRCPPGPPRRLALF